MGGKPPLELGVCGPHIGFAVEEAERELVDVRVPGLVGRSPLGAGYFVALLAPNAEDFLGDEAPVGVVNVIPMVIAIEDRKLSTVYIAKLISGDVEHECDEGVDLYQCLPSIFSDSQGSTWGPLLGYNSQAGTVRACSSTNPLLVFERLSIDVMPEISVDVRNAVEPQDANEKRCL
jgi:hypothetical protein